MQDHRNDLSAPVALKVELRVYDLVKEPVLAACEDRVGGLTCKLCFKMIAPEHDIEHAEIELVFADVVSRCGGIEGDLLRLGWRLGRAQFSGRTVAVLVQDKSVDRAIRIAR